MLSAAGLSVAFGPRTILENVSLTVDDRSRIGLVGANGSGKSTLMRILAGLDTPDSGSVTTARDARVIYLAQREQVPLDITVTEAADRGFAHLHRLLAERTELATHLETTPEDVVTLHRVSEIDTHLERSGYWQRGAEIGRILEGLGFAPDELQRKVGELSGGWRMRVALAIALLAQPTMLLLDEPTNYLDTEARLWLVSFLRDYPGGVVLVSHDRAVLDETVNEVLELFNARLVRYRGNYTTYETQRARELEALIARWRQQQSDIQRQEDFIRRFRAKSTKARQVQSRVRMLEKVERIELPEHLRPIDIVLSPAKPSGEIMVSLDGVSHTFDGPEILHQVSLTIRRGSRIAVVGRNGAGKTTLLRIIAGALSPTAGSATFGSGVEVAYFSQESPDRLPGEPTILEWMESQASSDALPRIRDTLGAFLFRGDDVEKRLGVLSGGERSRLVMAGLLSRPANLLILDEPTNHLDLASQDVLARALTTYTGAILLVSHDRDFLHRVATHVLALWPRDRRASSPGRRGWEWYEGAYRDYPDSRLGDVYGTAGPIRTDGDPGAETGQPSSQQPTSTETAEDRRRRKELKAQERRLLREEEELLERIPELEERHGAVSAALADPALYAATSRDGGSVGRIQDLQEELAQLADAVTSHTARFEEIGDQLEELRRQYTD